MLLAATINEDYAMEIMLLHRYRDLSDGLSVVDFDYNFDWYHGDHCPKFDLSLRLFNWTIFEFIIFNMMSVEDDGEDEMSNIQKQCWDNYHAAWTKKDFEESDKAFIELIKNSGINTHMTKKDQRLIWESFNQTQQETFFYPQVDGKVVELNLGPNGSIISQAPDGELVVGGTTLGGFTIDFPTGLNPQRKLSYRESQQPQIKGEIIKHLETTLNRSSRDPKFVEQQEMRAADYNRGGNYKGD